MTEPLNESLPFEDDDIGDYLVKTIERIINKAFENKMIDETTYRRLCAELSEYGDDDLDYLDFILQEFIHYGMEGLLDRIKRGAIFIDNISEIDTRYEKATERYDGLVDQYISVKERREAFERNNKQNQQD